MLSRRCGIRASATAGVAALLATVAVPAMYADDGLQRGTEVTSEVPASDEARQVAESLANAAESGGEEALPVIATYDVRASEGGTSSSEPVWASFPVPDGCQGDAATYTLHCGDGTLAIHPAVLTEDGVEVESKVTVTQREVVVSTAPGVDVSDALAFALFVGDPADARAMNDAANAFASSLATDDDVPTQAELDEEEAELNAGIFDPEDVSTSGQFEPVTGDVSVMKFKRPAKVTVPSSYVYCKTYTAKKCKPKQWHDYCT